MIAVLGGCADLPSDSSDSGTDAGNSIPDAAPLADGSGGSDAIAPDSAPTPPSPPTPLCGGTTRTLQPTAPNNEVYCPNGCSQMAAWQPGDVIQMPSGNWNLIDIGGISGTEGCPITFVNQGGVVTVETVRFRVGTRYMRFLGSGFGQAPYGIKVVSKGGVAMYSGASDFEIGYVEATGGDVGFMIKRDPSVSEPASQYPAVQANISIHDSFIHDVAGEGMYIGHTYPKGDPYHDNLVPSRLDHVTIFDNVVTRTGWDGIQLSNCRNNAEIKNNSVSKFGMTDIDSQRAGIILGGNCSGDVHDNEVEDGTGNGIQIFGFGAIAVYGNFVSEAGKTKTVSYGEEGIYTSDYVTTPENNPPQQLKIEANTVRNAVPSPTRRGAIRVNRYANHLQQVAIDKNDMWLTGANATGWEAQYLVSPADATLAGNVLHAGGF